MKRTLIALVFSLGAVGAGLAQVSYDRCFVVCHGVASEIYEATGSVDDATAVLMGCMDGCHRAT